MNLPYLALYMVREFSRPLTRPDWKTCKMHESQIIYKHINEFRERHQKAIHTACNADPYGMRKYKKMGDELEEWTHYGRLIVMKRFKKQPGWRRTMPVLYVPPPLINEPDWYFLKMRWFMSPHY